MNELNVDNYKDADILKRIQTIDYVNYEIPSGIALSENEVKIIEKVPKFQKFMAKADKFVNDGDRTVFQSFFFYDPCYIAMEDDSIIKKTCVKLEQKAKIMFFIGSKMSQMEQIYIAVDAQDNDKTIYNSDSLRAKNFKMIEGFYDNCIKFYLSLIMDYYYDCYDFKLTGVDINICAVRSAELVITLMNKFKSDFEKQYAPDKTLNDVKDEMMPDPMKKPKKQIKPKKTKKPKAEKIIYVKEEEKK